jgi:hypothetical protein
MQNTARVQSNPDTLIKNFFIAGLTQKTLVDLHGKGLEKLYNISPEMLFSLYQEPNEEIPFLKFVFPDYITITCVVEETVPKFYTFMSTNPDGKNAFYHSLIFYEKFYAHDLKTDFDSTNEAVKSAMRKKRTQLK